MRPVDARRETTNGANHVSRSARQPSPPESLIQLWDVATGKEIRRIGMGKIRIIRAVLAPDGKSLATAATDKTIRLWDLATGREIRRFGRGDVRSLTASHSRRTARSWRPRKRLGPDFPTAGESLPLTRDDPRLGHGHGPRAHATGRLTTTVVACFSPDGTTLATVGGQVIRLWDVASGREIRPQTGHRSAIERRRPSFPSCQSIMTLGRDRTIRFWDSATGKEIRQFEAGDVGIRFAALAAEWQDCWRPAAAFSPPALGRGLGARAAAVSNARQDP